MRNALHLGLAVSLFVFSIVPVSHAQTAPPCETYACGYNSSDMPECQTPQRGGYWVRCEVKTQCAWYWSPQLGWHMSCYVDCYGDYCLEV